MVLAGFFAAILFLGLLVGDRLYFRTLSAEASRYGCRVGRQEDRVDAADLAQIRACFDGLGVLALRHGVARLFLDANRILLRRVRRASFPADLFRRARRVGGGHPEGGFG